MATNFFRGFAQGFTPAFQQSFAQSGRRQERKTFREVEAKERETIRDVQAKARQQESDRRQEQFIATALLKFGQLTPAEQDNIGSLIQPFLTGGLSPEKLESANIAFAGMKAQNKASRDAFQAGLRGAPASVAPSPAGPPVGTGLVSTGPRPASARPDLPGAPGPRPGALGVAPGVAPEPDLARPGPARGTFPPTAAAVQPPQAREDQLDQARRRIEPMLFDPQFSPAQKEQIQGRLDQINDEAKREQTQRLRGVKQDLATTERRFEVFLKTRAAIRQEPVYKNFTGAQQAFNILLDSAALGTNLGDVALGSGFARLIDPNSVVRPQEAAAIAQAQSMVDRIRAAAPKIAGKGVFTKEFRAEILALAKKIFGRYAANVRDDLTPVYRRLLEGQPVNVGEVLRDPGLNIRTPTGAGGQAGRRSPESPKPRLQGLLEKATPEQRLQILEGR